MLETLDTVRWTPLAGAVIQGRPVAAWIRELPTEEDGRGAEALHEVLFGEDPCHSPRVTPLGEAVLPFLIEIIETPGKHLREGAVELFGVFMNAAPEHVDAYELDRHVTAHDINAAYFRWKRVQDRVRTTLPALLDYVAEGGEWIRDLHCVVNVLCGAVDHAMAVAPVLRNGDSLVQVAQRMAPALTQEERTRWIARIAEAAVRKERVKDSTPDPWARAAIRFLISPPDGRPLAQRWLEQAFLRLEPRERELVLEVL